MNRAEIQRDLSLDYAGTEAINTIDKRQIRFYLGRLSDDDMAGVDAAITSHLGYEIAWSIEAP